MKKYKKLTIYSLLLILMAGAIFYGYNHIEKMKGNTYTLYIGGYGQKGYKYTFSTKTMEYSKQGEFSVVNPSFLTLSPDGSLLYSVSENAKKSKVVTFDNSPNFPLLSEAQGVGAGPCYILYYKGYLFTANYDDGSVTMFKTDTNGIISRTVQKLKFLTSSNDKSIHRIHTVRALKGKFSQNDYIIATDTGADMIYLYKMQRDTLVNSDLENEKEVDYKLYKCTPSSLSLAKKSGPRHIEFSRDGKFLFLICEKSGDIIVYRLGERDGNLDFKQIGIVNGDIYKGLASADIHLSPDGEYLYTSHRKSKDGISIFKVDNGSLNLIAYQATPSYPRSFSITPDGEYMFVACQKDMSVQLYKVNKRTGHLMNTQKALTFTDLEPSIVLIK